MGWKNLDLDRSSWRKAKHNGKRDFEQNRVAHNRLRRVIRKNHNVNFHKNVATKFDLMH